MHFITSVLLVTARLTAMTPEPVATVERWGVFELALPGESRGNPYVDVTLKAAFLHDGASTTVTGFYDGGGLYRLRFMPSAEGVWTFTTASSDPALDGRKGSFTCIPAAPGNHGPVRVRDTYHFAYEDGTPFHHFGTTCYNWINQPEALQEQTLETLKTNGFNKARFLVFPKYYDFNKDAPALWAFEGEPGKWNFDRPVYAFFQNLDTRVRQLRDLGIEADIILTHPYDKWGFREMAGESEDRYFRYLAARLSAYRNVWWSMCNEYEFRPRPEAYWDRMFQIVREADPYNHLRSIHNAFKVYDHTKPWVTHASLQEQTREKTPVDFTMSMTRELRVKYGKPVVWDEVKYEGNLPRQYFWGTLSAEEMTRRFWIGLIHGSYVGHSETYMHPQDIIWWGRGGSLYGGSPARIAFLRRIVEQHVPGQKLDPVEGDMTAARNGKACFLYYFSDTVATNRSFSLPAGIQYRALVIDTWNMTQTDAGLHAGSFTLPLPPAPYLAVLFLQAGTVPVPDEVFVMGVNMNGRAVTIDGNAWLSDEAARAGGFSVSPTPNRWTGAVAPDPAAGAEVEAMLNSALWHEPPGLEFSQPLPAGRYHVYLWVMENYKSNIRSFAVQAEGATVAGNIGTQVFGSWIKYGPYAATVSDGALTVKLVSHIEAPHVMGLAIFRVADRGGAAAERSKP